MIDEITAAVLVGTAILFTPYLYECGNDRLGDKNKRQDVIVRGLLMTCVAATNALLDALTRSGDLKRGVLVFAASFNESLAIFFLLFDYTIAWILIRNKIVELKNLSWFDYLGKVGSVDNWAPWRGLTQWQRFWIRAAFFVVSSAIYAACLIWA